MLRTKFTDLLGLDYPIMSAPMSNHSGGQLAAAVCRAGGLGTFGGSNNFGTEWLKTQISFIREQTHRPFGIGFITHLIERNPENFEIALSEQAPVMIFSFADPRPWLRRAKDAGAITICQVQTSEAAVLALDAGADILLAQGNEAGGHTGEMNLLPLLVDLVQNHPDVAALAAGGIASGRALAAVMAAGAEGASLGTALLATPEAVEVPQEFKEQILRSSGSDTAYTRLYDLLSDEPWPAGIAGRVYRNRLVRRWDNRDDEIMAHREELVSDIAAGRTRHDPETTSVYMGQGVGSVNSIQAAGDAVREICDGAEAILRSLSYG